MKRLVSATLLSILLTACGETKDIAKIQDIEARKGISGLSCRQVLIMANYYGGSGDRHYGSAKDSYDRGDDLSGGLHGGAMSANYNKADKYSLEFIDRKCKV